MWRALSGRLRQALQEICKVENLPRRATEAFEEVFGSTQIDAIRLISVNTNYGPQPDLIVQYPQICRNLLLSVDWLYPSGE